MIPSIEPKNVACEMVCVEPPSTTTFITVGLYCKTPYPAYVYATSSDDYKYLTITHKPESGKGDEYEPLKHNIDPAEDGKKRSYVKKRYGIKHRGLFEDTDKPYRIHKEDVSTIKKYKK